MMRLKKTVLNISEHNTTMLFNVPLLGNPSISQGQENQLNELCECVKARIQTVVTIVCSPHRVSNNNCVSIKLTGVSHTINILLTVTGNLCWPTEDDYAHSPRWYISVPDAVDAVYLIEQLGIRLGQYTE